MEVTRRDDSVAAEIVSIGDWLCQDGVIPRHQAVEPIAAVLIAEDRAVARERLTHALRRDVHAAQRISVGVDETSDDRAGANEGQGGSIDPLASGERWPRWSAGRRDGSEELSLVLARPRADGVLPRGQAAKLVAAARV